MRTIQITTEDIAKKVIEHHTLVEKGFISVQEHIDYCKSLAYFFGDEVYSEVCEIVTNK